MCYKLDEEILLGNVTIYCEHITCDHYSMKGTYAQERCGKISQDLPCVNDPLHDERLKKINENLRRPNGVSKDSPDFWKDNYQRTCGKIHGMKTYG